MPGTTDNSRRRFIKAGAVMGASLLIPACGGGNAPTNQPGNAPDNGAAHTPAGPVRLDRLGVIVGGGALPKEGGGKEFYVGITNLDAAEPQARPVAGIGFLGHGDASRPYEPTAKRGTRPSRGSFLPGVPASIDVLERAVRLRLGAVKKSSRQRTTS